MARRSSGWILLPICLGLFGLFACASPPLAHQEDWYVNGVHRGTLTRNEVPGGFEYAYTDLEHRLVRLERRDDEGELRGGACARSLRYDDLGRVSRVAYHGADGALAIGPDGCAVEEIHHGTDGVGRATSTHAYLDPGGRPMTIRDGYARKRVLWAEGKPMHLRFFDLDDRPISVTFENVPGTSEVEFSYLRGVTPLTYAILRDSGGSILAKKRVSGVVYRHESTSSSRIPSWNEDLGMVSGGWGTPRTEVIER